MYRWLVIPFLLISSEAQAFFFPEMPMCPFGGPPGWVNRITNDDYYRNPPPRYGYQPMPRQYYPNTPVHPARPPTHCGDRRSGYCPLR